MFPRIRPCFLSLLFGIDLGEAGADHFFEEGGGEGLVGRELDSAFGEFVRFEIGLELFDNSGGGKKRTVVGEGGKPNEDLFVFEGGNAVADDFGGFAGDGGTNGGTNGGANFLERGALRFGDGGEIGVDGGVGLGGFGGAFARGRFCFLHDANGIRSQRRGRARAGH